MPQSYTNGHAPDAYVMKQRTRWVTCDLPEYEGFAVKLVTSPTYGTLYAERKALEENEEAYFQAIAPRVLEWNAQAEGPDGAIVPIPSPAEGGWEAFYTIEQPLLTWLLVKVRLAHVPERDDPKGGSAPEPSAPSPGPSLVRADPNLSA